MSNTPEDVSPETKEGNLSADSIDSVDSLEDPFDVTHDPNLDKDSYKSPDTDPEEVPRFQVGSWFCEDPHSSKLATWFHLVYASVIIASWVAFCTETLNFEDSLRGEICRFLRMSFGGTVHWHIHSRYRFERRGYASLLL